MGLSEQEDRHWNEGWTYSTSGYSRVLLGSAAARKNKAARNYAETLVQLQPVRDESLNNLHLIGDDFNSSWSRFDDILRDKPLREVRYQPYSKFVTTLPIVSASITIVGVLAFAAGISSGSYNLLVLGVFLTVVFGMLFLTAQKIKDARGKAIKKHERLYRISSD